MNLAGVLCTNVKTVSGGAITAPVIEQKVAGGAFPEKHIGPPTYGEFVVQVGLGSIPDLYAWISSSWTTSPERRDGSVVTAGFDGNATSERRFTNARVTGVTVPTLDGSSKDAGHLTVTFEPELIRTQPASGKVPASVKAAKQWLCSNFRLELDGIDTTRVATIESFTVTNAAVDDVVGDRRDLTREPTLPQFPNLVVSVSAASAQSWQTWFDDFVVGGNNDRSKAKSGAMVFLGPDMSKELGRIALHNVGICALRSPTLGDATQTAARFSAELYCDWMELHVGVPVPAPAPTPEPAPPVIPIRPEPRPTPIVPHR
jgi:hypothetical protein